MPGRKKKPSNNNNETKKKVIKKTPLTRKTTPRVSDFQYNVYCLNENTHHFDTTTKIANFFITVNTQIAPEEFRKPGRAYKGLKLTRAEWIPHMKDMFETMFDEEDFRSAVIRYMNCTEDDISINDVTMNYSIEFSDEKLPDNVYKNGKRASVHFHVLLVLEYTKNVSNGYPLLNIETLRNRATDFLIGLCSTGEDTEAYTDVEAHVNVKYVPDEVRKKRDYLLKSFFNKNS